MVNFTRLVGRCNRWQTYGEEKIAELERTWHDKGFRPPYIVSGCCWTFRSCQCIKNRMCHRRPIEVWRMLPDTWRTLYLVLCQYGISAEIGTRRYDPRPRFSHFCARRDVPPNSARSRCCKIRSRDRAIETDTTSLLFAFSDDVCSREFCFRMGLQAWFGHRYNY